MTKSAVLRKLLIFNLVQLMIAFSGCSKSNTGYLSENNNTNPITPSTTDTATGKRYLALGDSYTIGQSVAEQDRFPAQTVEILKSAKIKINKPQFIATTGWTTANLQNAIAVEKPQGPYDVVSLLVGVNDQYQHFDTAGYRVRFTQLLLKSVELAGNNASKVFVLSIPDYSATPFVASADKARVSKEIDEFNAINMQVTLKYNITYIDITLGSRDAATNPALVANDGLHPSGAEYKKWADKLAAEMKKVLQ